MKELLRFLTCGSVDDGKSTLIGRLLYDAGLLFKDQREDFDRSEENSYADLLDGLQDEKAQGITIDVAYRYFSTEKRSFIVADTPGHEQYTRNMAVGASNASLAVLLIDISKRIQVQTYRHARICRLMGIAHFVFAVNKMDLVDYSEKSFREIEKQLEEIKKELDLDDVYTIPLSAKYGDNVITDSVSMKWYEGMCLLKYLENVDVRKKASDGAFILPVQRVCRSDQKYRGYEGQIVCGSVAVGDEVRILPGNGQARIKSIIVAGRETETAYSGQPVSVSLDRELDVARGSVIAADDRLCVTESFAARIVWLSDDPLKAGQSCYLKLSSQQVPVKITSVVYETELETGAEKPCTVVRKNSIAKVEIIASRKLICTVFANVEELGRFLLIDRLSNETSACGIIEELEPENNLTFQKNSVTRQMRSALLHQTPVTIWMTGLSGSGKSTLADALERRLHGMGHLTMIMDGDNIRMGLNRDLRFSDADRTENIRRIAEVARLMNDAGLIVITAFISPFEADRELARSIIGKDCFFEVHVDTPLEVCEERDAKGLYAKARQGIIRDLTGISSPYEEPLHPDLRIDMTSLAPEEGAQLLLDKLIGKGYFI